MDDARASTPDRYRALLERLDRWFAAGAEAAGGVPCRAGCSACCHGPFDISIADAELVLAGFARLPAETRDAVRRRARALLDAMLALAPDWRAPYAIADLGEERFDRIGDALAAEPCPLLDEAGRCLVYADRPLVCRLIGLPMRSPAERVIENACPIQDRFPAYAALSPVPFDLEDFEDEEAAGLVAAAERLAGTPDAASRETTIAALLADSEESG